MNTTAHLARTTSFRRRALSVAAALPVLTVAVASISPIANADGNNSRPPAACTITPTASSMPFHVDALLGTVRVENGAMKILHNVQCTDGRTGTVWISSDII